MMYGQCCGVRVCLYDHGVSVCCMFKESVMQNTSDESHRCFALIRLGARRITKDAEHFAWTTRCRQLSRFTLWEWILFYFD